MLLDFFYNQHKTVSAIFLLEWIKRSGKVELLVVEPLQVCKENGEGRLELLSGILPETEKV